MGVYFKGLHCNKRMDRIHEKSFRLIRNGYESSFCDMLSTLNEKIIHQRFINVLLSEVYKYLNGIFPELMYEVSYLHQNHYNLMQFKRSFINLSYYAETFLVGAVPTDVGFHFQNCKQKSDTKNFCLFVYLQGYNNKSKFLFLETVHSSRNSSYLEMSHVWAKC